MAAQADTFIHLTVTAWSAITGLATAALVLLAALAWVLARKQLRATVRVWKDETRPYVIVDFEPGLAEPKVIDFVVRNIGRTPAYDVQIDWAVPPKRVRDDAWPFADVKLFTKPIPMLAPGREYRIFFDTTIDRHNAHQTKTGSLPAEYPVTVRYHGKQGSDWVETVDLDPDLLQGSIYAEIFTTHDVGKALTQIAADLHGSPILNDELMIAMETRDQYDERRAAQRASAAARHAALVERVLPRGNASPTDEPDAQTGV